MERRPIDTYTFMGRPTVTLVLGGIHGDEPKSVYVAQKLIEHLRCHPPGRTVVVVPMANPDGYAKRRRRNAAGVDINRNFPTSDWTPAPQWRRFYPGPTPGSEPETRSMIALIESVRPNRIISIHSIDRHRHCNNFDGPGKHLAQAMGQRNKYRVRASMGYPTPGSLGVWAGCERRIAMVTLELPSHRSPQRCWEDNRDALSVCCG